MKTFDFLASAFAIVIGVVSCSKEETMTSDPSPVGRQIKLVASTESCVDTKTSLSGNDSDGYQVLWSEGDKIVLTKDYFSYSTFTLSEGGSGSTTGVFTGTCDGGDGIYHVFYATDGKWLSNSSEYSGRDMIPSAPMAAEVTIQDGVASVAKFKNLCGLMRLTLKGKGSIKEIKVHTDKPLSGRYSIDSDGCATIERGYDGDWDYTLSCGDGVDLSSTGTDFYIPLPQNEFEGMRIVITDFDGNTCTKSLNAGRKLKVDRARITPISLSVTGFAPARGALPGEFTVNENGKKVYFSRGNLYWDGDSYEFEANQYDRQSAWTENHVDHFYWSVDASAARGRTFVNPGIDENAVLFTNKADFTACGVRGKYRTLSSAEWTYLLNNHSHNWVTVNGVHGLVIAPDGFAGGLSDAYDGATLSNNNLVFLPADGYLNLGEQTGNAFVEFGNEGKYWSSTPTDSADGNAYSINFRYDLGLKLIKKNIQHCTLGLSIRLVTDKAMDSAL